MKRVLLGLGSNKTYNGFSPAELLFLAGIELRKIMKDVRFSYVYKTKAMYVEDQDDFYNSAAVGYVEDDVDAFSFLKTINKIEEKYGRDRSKELRFGPRSLDIDIELFGDEEINTHELQIPHARIHEREFVLIPALEIFTDSADEIIRERYIKYLAKLKENGKGYGIQKISEFPKAVENGTERLYSCNS